MIKTNRRKILLNADLGEGCGNDAGILPFIDLANIACGGHAGDTNTIETTIKLAKQHNVVMGAHPGYPDRAGFGRQLMPLTAGELTASLTEQLQLIDSIAKSLGCHLNHIKPHGALYNQAEQDSALANQLVAVFAAFNPQLSIIGLAGGQLIAAARAVGLATLEEGFIDRRYQPNGQLTARDSAGAVISSDSEAISQAKQLLTSSSVTAVDNSVTSLRCDTLCLHGDGERAVELAKQISQLF